MKKISKRVRDEAIMICAIAASTPDLCEFYNGVRNCLGASSEAFSLALDAWSLVSDHYYNGSTAAELDDNGHRPTVDAEAEALLRKGWSPGDTVY